MLDHLAVHVENVETTVGSIDKIDRPEPIRDRSEKLAPFLSRPAPGDRLHCAVRMGDHLSMHQVAAGIADESVSGIFGTIRVAGKDRRPGGTGEISRNSAATFHRPRNHTAHPPARANDAPRLVRTEPKNFRRRSIDRDIDPRSRHREIRIRFHLPRLPHDRLQVMAIAAREASSVGVEAHAELRTEILQPKLPGFRIEGNIPTADPHCLPSGSPPRRREPPL